MTMGAMLHLTRIQRAKYAIGFPRWDEDIVTMKRTLVHLDLKSRRQQPLRSRSR
jgi:hypothetical protein